MADEEAQTESRRKASRREGRRARSAKRGAKGGGGDGATHSGPVTTTVDAVPPRLAGTYRDKVVPALTKQFNYKNPMQVPRLRGVITGQLWSSGCRREPEDHRHGGAEPRRSADSRSSPRSKKAIANFKLRAGLPIGAMVTLRSARMWEFLDRLVTLALPRTRDFKGVSRKAFDGKGNYTLGLKEQIIFPEIDYDRIDVIKEGLNVRLRHDGETDEEGRALLQHLGPFRAA